MTGLPCLPTIGVGAVRMGESDAKISISPILGSLIVVSILRISIDL